LLVVRETLTVRQGGDNAAIAKRTGLPEDTTARLLKELNSMKYMGEHVLVERSGNAWTTRF
jgi:DNA-binding IclR family transcriptional regulator